jgi:chromosome segregation ATPase
MSGSNKSTNGARTQDDSPMATAAAAFEDELRRLAALTADLVRTPLSSDKALLRAKKALTESSESQARLATRLQEVVAAIDGARLKQEACLKQLVEAAERVQGRAREFSVLVERFAALGQRAREVNDPVRAVVARKEEGAPVSEVLAGLREVLDRTETLVAEADALAKDARESDWPDVARETDSLKQQMQAARNRLLQAERSVEKPS